jgi:hypothetical protein
MAATGRELTYRAEAIGTGRETICNDDRENTVHGRGVDALEEGKHRGVQGSSRVKMFPYMTPLQLPLTSCWPSVSVFPSQKLMLMDESEQGFS